MAFLSSMNISGSALTAQRLRLDVISENIANMDITRTEGGGPYRRKTVVFEAINGSNFRNILENSMNQRPTGVSGNAEVQVSDIVEDQSPLKAVYDPGHPDADPNGYVSYPNVNLLQETIDAMSASRSYEANVTALNAIKSMAVKALEVGK